MRITSRPHFLPMFLALSCLVLLFIPIYYVDLWSISGTPVPERISLDHQEPERVPLELVVPQEHEQSTTTQSPHTTEEYSLDKDIKSNKKNITEIQIVMTTVLTNNDTTFKLLPRLSKLEPLPTINVTNLALMRLPIQRNIANVAEFALRMSRERIHIEKYGPKVLTKNSVKGRFSNRINSDSYNDNEENNQTSKEPTQVLIVTYFRGGSTFFGDLLNEYPGTYYHFEPLHMVTQDDQVQSEEDVSESIDLLRHLLRCQYEDVPQYVNYVRHNDHKFLFEHNRRLWFSCQFHPTLCFDDTFLSSVCKLHPIHIFKLVRLRLAHAKGLLDEFPSLRIIYLVRDPRGLFNSRRELTWCTATKSCIDPYSYCTDMEQDLAVATKLKAKMSDRFLALRYEDISIDPDNQMKRVLSFLGLSPHPRLQRFIKSHTKSSLGDNLGGPYSTKRDSKKTPFLWRQKLSPENVAYVEDACSDVIKRLNFS